MNPNTHESVYREELDRHNAIGEFYKKNGYGTTPDADDKMTHDAEDAVSHLKAMPEEEAVAKAKEWTGRDDIGTLDEAIAAVEEELGGGTGG